jgi:hypothetical protein
MSKPWTKEELALLKARAREMGVRFSLDGLALWARRSKADVDLALFAMTGRSPEEAAQALAAGPAPLDWTAKDPGRLRRFLGEVFG